MPADSDPTPFSTRSRLASTYAAQVRAIREGSDDPFPVAIEVNPSAGCSQACAWCLTADTQGRDRLDIDDPSVQRFFGDFARRGGRALTWSGGGEPTHHPQLDRLLQLAGDAGLAQGLMSHGAFDPALVPEIARWCSWVRISLDTHDPQAYSRQRRAGTQAWERAVARIHELARAGARVGVNMNIAGWNAAHIEPTWQLVSSLGAAYLQVRPTLPLPFTHRHTPLDEGIPAHVIPQVLKAIERIQGRAGGMPLIASMDKLQDLQRPDGGRRYPGCRSHRLLVVLHADARLYVCMYHLDDARFCLGSIAEQPLDELWRSGRRREVLRYCEQDLDLSTCQICCKGHELNKVLYDQVELPRVEAPDASPFL